MRGLVGALALAKVAARQGHHPYLGLLGLLGGARTMLYVRECVCCVCVCVCVRVYEEGASRFVSWAIGVVRWQLSAQHDPYVSIDTVASQGNELGAAGAEALLPALEKLTNLGYLYLAGTCGDVQRRSTQCEQCARVVGGAGERSEQAVMVVCDGSLVCEV